MQKSGKNLKYKILQFKTFHIMDTDAVFLS